MKIILLTQDPHLPGGIANLFKIFKPKFRVPVDYYIMGSRSSTEHLFSKVRRLVRDYRSYMLALKTHDIVHLNTSLRIKSFFRDAVFLLLAKSCDKKVLLFIHGWNPRFEKTITRHLLWVFKHVFFQADVIIVLCEQFKQRLLDWGYQQEIQLLSTAVDDALVEVCTLDHILQKIQDDTFQLLFLSRIEKQKGVYETIEAYAQLKSRYPFLRLTIAGVGSELPHVMDYAQTKNIRDVEFPGFIQGREKQRMLKKAHLFCFPTRYGEGMPTNVIEAMAFGLPVITTPVGGLKDFFIPGEMGYFTPANKPTELARLIETLILDHALRTNMGIHNFEYARGHFLASQVVNRLEELYAQLDQTLTTPIVITDNSVTRSHLIHNRKLNTNTMSEINKKKSKPLVR